MSSIVPSNHDDVDRQDDLDPDERYWIDLMLKQIRVLDLPDGSSLPLRARYLNSEAEVGEPRFKWLETKISAPVDDFPFPLSPSILVQFFIEGAWYCFHHGLWQWESIEGKQRLVISNPWHESFAGLGRA